LPLHLEDFVFEFLESSPRCYIAEKAALALGAGIESRLAVSAESLSPSWMRFESVFSAFFSKKVGESFRLLPFGAHQRSPAGANLLRPHEFGFSVRF